MTRCNPRDRLGFCHSCGARNGEPHHQPPALNPDDALTALAHGYRVIDGHWIQPHMIRTETATRITCTNGKTINKTGSSK